ncbi:MAG TPA: exonuclease [Gammaproteobacteria bacterium]|nr:exonuclease [Gammaproteobacteria bacterium]
MDEIYVSVDIEADGFTPGANSMLSLGAAAYLGDKTLLGTFSMNLETLPGASAHPATMKWWQGFPEAWDACRRDPRPPGEVMRAFADWVRALPGHPVFAGYPVSFDFSFVSWYLHHYARDNPFGFAALDIKSYAMALTGGTFRHTTKRSMPVAWFDDLPHTHRALDDALEQGALLCNLLALRRRESR